MICVAKLSNNRTICPLTCELILELNHSSVTYVEKNLLHQDDQVTYQRAFERIPEPNHAIVNVAKKYSKQKIPEINT